MDVTPLIKKGQQIIQSYADGGFKVSGARYEGGIIVTSPATFVWNVSTLEAAALNAQDFKCFEEFQGQIDILILGTGAQHVFLAPALLKSVKLLNINAEAMDTGAACRTYNVLMTEGRRVAAALLPVMGP